jgi:hypothetical protein
MRNEMDLSMPVVREEMLMDVRWQRGLGPPSDRLGVDPLPVCLLVEIAQGRVGGPLTQPKALPPRKPSSPD